MANERKAVLPEEASLVEKVLVPVKTVQPPATTGNTLVTSYKKFPENLPEELNLVQDQKGIAHAVITENGNPYALRVGSKRLNNIIRDRAQQEGLTLRKADITDVNYFLQAHAETTGTLRDTWYRVAPVEDGVEVDIGDELLTRVRITAGKVEIIKEGSETLFHRTPVSQPMVMPAETGDINLLKRYLNLHAASQTLLIGWLSYTLAHPKAPTSKYVILVLQGSQGSGKTSLCSNIILPLIDPSHVNVQILPRNDKDLAIALQNAHVLCFDNVRGFAPTMADTLCRSATGGAMSCRQLYTDSDQQVFYLHGALVLNGIHSFIDQPDLAQRCLPIELLHIPEDNRKSDVDLVKEFQADLPAIIRGLFDLIAEVFKHLPNVEVTNPERMIEFSRWLAALEKIDGAPPGAYQEEYSRALREGQLDSLQDNPLAAAVLGFVDDFRNDEWFGAPAELLSELNAKASRGTQRSKEWPLNPIALSKRLAPLQAGLATQGIMIEFGRGKHRTITITVKRGENE